MNMLSKYISESEFTITQVRGVDNSLPAGTIKNNAIILCNDYLDIIRAYYNKPLIITSGYRSPAVNKKVGGSVKPPSKHMGGNATDFHVIGVSLQQLFNDIVLGNIKQSNGKPLMDIVDQVVFENPSNPWIHIGRCNGTPRRQKMKAVFNKAGKPTYTNVNKI